MKINRKRKSKMEIVYLALLPLVDLQLVPLKYQKLFEIATFIYKSHLFSLDL